MTEEPYIVTHTGKKICPVNPDPEEICIEDIAHSLAYKCRFGGHTNQYFSVAQHSVIVSNFCSHSLHGLLHDAAEAYLSDVATTVKCLFPTMRYAEQILQETIEYKFGLSEVGEDDRKNTKLVDKAVLLVEWEALIDNPNEYDIAVDTDDVPRLHWKLAGCWMPVEAERVFLRRFRELYNGE
jgi:hypothetical protein